MDSIDVTRELEAIVRLLQGQSSVNTTAEVVTDTAVRWTGGETMAGITIVRRRQRVETIGATHDLAAQGDALQYDLSEGPCLDAVWEQKQVFSPILSSEDRWPRWAPQMSERFGVSSMLCTRLFTNDNTLGALNIYARQVNAFDEGVRDDIATLAAYAAVAVAAAQQITSLTTAVDRRTTIGMAMGILMARYEIDQDTAFATLQRLSSERSTKVFDVCLQVIASAHSVTEGNQRTD